MTGRGSDSQNPLGEYLRARRELVAPRAVGLPEDSRRRVPGLRREEVALLAGISSDYYLRLEQGRNRNPSAQVLGSIARVLQLDEPSTQHLLGLSTAPRPPRREPRGREALTPRVLDLLRTVNAPAFVAGRYTDVLASNPLARALSPELRPGENLLRTAFLDTDHRLYLDRREMVAMFRKRVGTDLSDPRVAQLVEELSQASTAFQQAWARHDVRPPRGGLVRVDHPQVGTMDLNVSKLAIDDTDEQLLVVYHPDHAHPESADRLTLLASLTAGTPSSRARVEDR
ncbi:helix-turn-helix domain-containing protein [Nocardiopsis deserti]|uniref:helix-turn-helix domain-containing protein n=1 Tax=Nocardiopsis deserti TaxID=2605988 RepID=UPI0012387095|nr:helix-turn-helix transcriptional regulator [Nocardiopsis deserti]